MSAMIQVRVDADLFQAAKSAGADAGRSAAAQIRHWARIGREFETAALLDEDAEDAQEAAEVIARTESGQERTYTTAEVADVPTADVAGEDAADVAAFDAAMAEEGENIPWEQVERQALEETAHLLRSPANATRLLESIAHLESVAQHRAGTTHAEVHQSIQHLIETFEAQGHGDELVVVLLRELAEILTKRQPRGGALSDEQVAFLIESGAFTATEFAETEASLARGDLAKLERKTRLAAITDSLSVAEVAQVLSIDAARVRRRQAKSDLYAFLAGGRRRYPLWQFTGDPARPVLPGLAALVHGIPADMHPASVQGFMTTPQEDLRVDGERMTPVDWLLRGGDAEALVAILGSFLQM